MIIPFSLDKTDNSLLHLNKDCIPICFQSIAEKDEDKIIQFTHLITLQKKAAFTS